jgi:hypothetical protein
MLESFLIALKNYICMDYFYEGNKGPCHVSGIFLPLRVNSLPLATIYEVKIPLRKWKISLLQRNPAQMTWAIDCSGERLHVVCPQNFILLYHFKTDIGNLLDLGTIWTWEPYGPGNHMDMGMFLTGTIWT